MLLIGSLPSAHPPALVTPVHPNINTANESSDIILFFMIIPLFLINYSLYYSINQHPVKFLRVFFLHKYVYNHHIIEKSMLKLPFSAFSEANSYYFMNGKPVQYSDFDNGEVYDNDYMSRSTIPEDIKEKKHILFIGDSFIFGDKLLKHEIISAHFEKTLNNDKYCVINLATNGSSLEHATLRLQQWCNSFPDNIHSVYLGITSLTRSTHWFLEERYLDGVDDSDVDLYSSYHPEKVMRFDYLLASPPKHDIQVMPKRIHKAETDLISKARMMRRLEDNLLYVKNISNAHNFSVYSFYTIDSNYQLLATVDEQEIIKSLIENNNFIYNYEHIISDAPRYEDTTDTQYHLPCMHWNSTGCKYMAKKLLGATKHWY
jgi:hypothetical protein